MKVSYKWLNEYFDHQLPAIEKVVDTLTMNSSEIDGIAKTDEDLILDVKILPNMAHSCLCHRGIAKELSVLLNLPMKKYSRDFKEVDTGISNLKLKIEIENGADCRRYIGRVIQNIKINKSPGWLKARLESLGQRSINNLVDATNFVMLEMGQPMHVFDADKIIGDTIRIKKAKAGDKIVTLDGKDVDLDESTLTISNNNNALAIAGIKGGTLAEIDEKTKNIVLESANFDPVLIRKTAQKLKIQTEASKRYENDLTPHIALEAMDLLTRIILDIASDSETKVGSIVDIYPSPVSLHQIKIKASEVEKILGLKIAEADIVNIFNKFNFIFEKEGDIFVVTIPEERLDLRIKEDLVEEIGRVYGYDKLPDSQNLSSDIKGTINKTFYYSTKIKKILAENGFSEIYGYSFAEGGDIELANSVSPEKKFLRKDLSSGLQQYLDFNTHYTEIIDMDQIKIFEIGQIFKKEGEYMHLVIGVQTPVGIKKAKKDNAVLEEIVQIIEEEFKQKFTKIINKTENILEIDFLDFVETLEEPNAYDIELPSIPNDLRFKKISVYPFSVRDVAVFTPEQVNAEEVFAIIKNEAGNLMVRNKLFDVFTKTFPDGNKKTSYAYRLIFQSYDHTLSEEEINNVMKKITDKLNSQLNWQVR